MASIIKNQILKYLSKYFKNLSTDKINFNTIKGEGEVSDLKLDEIALTDLLDLPAWMRITSAQCNKVNFQIPWTKLKSEPMIWNLDEVTVTVETCEVLRTPDAGVGNLLQSPGKYNFIIKTVDGMTINVNTVLIDFSSSTFTASIQILRIVAESTSSAWEKCDLRHTRIKDSKRGELLLFKEVRWQNLRIEAKSVIEKAIPPLRLLTNETAVCRIIIKKRLSDCFIMGSKLVLILKEILWVLTDSQLKAALHFLDTISELIKKANDVVRKKKAARKLEVLPEYQAQLSQQETMMRQTAFSHIFSCHDVIETSYHFIAEKIHLHLSDDPGPERSIHPDLEEGSSIRIQLIDLQVDYYPYHLAIKDRNHWGLYRTTRYPHPHWLSQSQNEFRNLLLSLVQDDFCNEISVPTEQKHIQNGISYFSPSSNNYNVRNYLSTQFNKIMTSCTVLRIGDFVVYRVTSKKDLPKEFLKADKTRYKLPETEIIHAEFTYYYYPGDIQFPLPSPKFYVQIYPIQIQLDNLTVIWLNSFLLNLHKSVLTTSVVKNHPSTSQMLYIDVRIEITMPQIIFEINTENEVMLSKDRPRCLQIEVSKVLITNTRITGTVSTRDNLAKVVNSCQLKTLFLSSEFPSKSSDYAAVTQKFLDHVQGKDNVRNFPNRLLNSVYTEKEIAEYLCQELLWIEAKDVWCINLESIWGDFGVVKTVGYSTVPFLDAFPVTLWLNINMPLSTHVSNSLADVQVLASVSNLISVQLNKYQATFLTILLQNISELTTFLSLDAEKMNKNGQQPTLVVASVIPQIEITLVTACQVSGKESSGVDMESSSIVPDSSSIDTHSVYWNSTKQNSVETTMNNENRKPSMKNKDCSNTTPYNSDFNNEGKSGKLKKLSILKKNFSNFMSMDFGSRSADDNVDSMSMRSDDSSDTENYLNHAGSDQLYLDDADAMFKVNCKKKHTNSNININVDIADDALNDNFGLETPTTSSGRCSVGIWKRKDSVAAITLKLNSLEFMLQSIGLNGFVKIQVDDVGVDECFSIPWDELQSKFSSRNRDWYESEEMKADVTTNARIKIRIQNLIDVPRKESMKNSIVTSLRNTKMDGSFKNIMLEVHSQTLKCLSELVEDQKIDENIKPIMFEILFDNISILFKKDVEIMQSPPAAPIIIKKLRILRENDCKIIIQPDQSCMTVTKNTSPICITNEQFETMNSEIELLRKRLTAMNYLKEENSALRQYQEEAKLLRSYLVSAQNQIAHLLEERRKMMDRLGVSSPSSPMSDNSGGKR